VPDRKGWESCCADADASKITRLANIAVTGAVEQHSHGYQQPYGEDMNTKFRALTIACALLGAVSMVAAAETDGATAPASAASAIKHAARKTGHAIAHGASEVATGTAHAAHRAASAVRTEAHKLPKGASAVNPQSSPDKKGGQ
jgi:hypothetical protein